MWLYCQSVPTHTTVFAGPNIDHTLLLSYVCVLHVYVCVCGLLLVVSVGNTVHMALYLCIRGVCKLLIAFLCFSLSYRIESMSSKMKR